jgi:hypothetical protein
MKKLLFSVTLFLIALLPVSLLAQPCTGGTLGGTLTIEGCWKSVAATGGQYYDFSAVAGQTYQFSFCTADGGSDVGDSYLTLLTSVGALVTSADDICNTNNAYISWTATSTATFRILPTNYPCNGGAVGTLRYRNTSATLTYGASVWNSYAYNGLDLNTYLGSITTMTINNSGQIQKSWGAGGAIGSCATTAVNGFSTRHMMNRTFAAGFYVFTYSSDDGIRISVDGGATWFVNIWGTATTSGSITVYLSGNKNVIVDQRENTGDASVNVSICQMAGDYTFGTYPTWNAYVFDNQSISAADYQGTFTTTGLVPTLINNTFGFGQPSMVAPRCSKTMDNDYYNVRYLSTKTYTNGVYVFTGNNDDGRRLSLDGGASYIINNWSATIGIESSAPVLLNGNYNMVYDMYEITGGAAANLSECQMSGGDLTAYGSGSWNAYAYNSANYNFLTSDYRGFFTTGSANSTSASFSLTDATVGSLRTGACGTAISADPSVRTRLNQTFLKGIYTLSAGSDDFFRFSVTGGSSWQINSNNTTITANAALNGSTNVVYEGYDTGGPGAFAGSIAVRAPVAGTLAATVGCPNTTLSWTGGVGFYTWQSSTDINFGTFTTIGTETNTVASATSAQTVNPSVVTYYRLRIESGGTVTYSNVVTVNPYADACASALHIASLPYTSAIISNTCATSDIPITNCTGPY